MSKFLEDIAIISGRVGWKGYTVDDLRDFGPWVIGANDITSNHKLTFENAKHISREKYEESPEIFIEKNDILVVKVGSTIGKVAIVNKNIGEACINPNTVLLKKCKENPFYLYYYLISDFGQKFLINNSSASAQSALNQTNLKKLPINFPTLNKQEQVVSILKSLDDKIELSNRINAELEAMAKTLYDYWFVQFDFPNAEDKPYKTSGGKMVYNETLKREIPEGWEVMSLGELGNFKNGVNYNPSNPGKIPCPIINVRNISNSSYFIKNEDLDIIYLNDNDVRKYSVNENSIIIARSGIPGATRLISDFSANTLYCGFAIHYEIYNPLLKNQVFFYLKSLEELIKSGSGGTIMKNVNQELLNNLIIQVPEKSISTAFNKKIDIIFKKINNLEKQNQELTALRDWLLPMLMNGQVKVG